MKLKDKAIIVTGSTMGIGAAVARGVHREGASVLVHGLESELGLRLVDELGDRAALHVDDLQDPNAPTRIVAAAIDAFGHLDGLVNNAAFVATGDVETTDVSLFDKLIAVNVRAPFFLIQAALPHLSRSRGAVVNIGSVNAYSGEPDLLPYSISKGALMTMSRNLGDALHREANVRVNQINPGWVLTEAERHRKKDQGMPEDWPAQLPKQFAPSGRLLTPEEIAEAVVFFLGDDCGPVSGSVLELEQHPMIGRNPPKC
jgi:NAD(P)-dependent dehydrogenase (short-subunit alcohol dehydrogenase family)